MTEALKTILDREKAEAEIAEHFRPTVAFLTDLVNYGTNLIVRCFEMGGSKGITEVIVLPVLGKQAVSHLDSFELHVEHGALVESHLPVRAIFEASLYIAWILEADSESRARHYNAWNLRQRRAAARRLIPGLTEHESSKAILQQHRAFADILTSPGAGALIPEATRQITEIDSKLATPQYAAIDAAFDRARGKRPYDPAWHVPCGAKSVRAIAEHLNRLSHYDFIYSPCSEVMHSGAMQKHVTIRDGGEVVFEPIRSLSGIKTICNFAVGITIDLYQKLLGTYREGELDSFRRKYVEEWRPALLAIPDVSYTVEYQARA